MHGSSFTHPPPHYLRGPLSTNATHALLESSVLSCPSLEGTEHHDLTSYLTVSAFHKMLVGWEGPPQSLWERWEMGKLVWAQFFTGGALVLKGRQCDGGGSSRGVS